MALLLVKKEVKRVKNLPKGGLTLIMGQKGGQKGQESDHSDRVWVKKEVKMAFINGSKILPKRRSYQKWVKKEVKKRVKEGQRSTGVVNVLRGNP